ncbi:hypothetical protein M0813_14259 [Anaeramoeba flamelloides]|uniref:Uncharacterized protein n=1 Tax=Anaeramoeba flamelloides TaxID=1746091 RepID=A0ABQ8Z671_9EUKA|nr:hypothetical protein M0813_14259 [Anaeramoeba flamelloides]
MFKFYSNLLIDESDNEESEKSMILESPEESYYEKPFIHQQIFFNEERNINQCNSNSSNSFNTSETKLNTTQFQTIQRSDQKMMGLYTNTQTQVSEVINRPFSQPNSTKGTDAKIFICNMPEEETREKKQLLSQFMKQKPRPRWEARIDKFNLLFPGIIKNWNPQLLKNGQINRVEIDKLFFKIFFEISNQQNHTRFNRNIQRSLTEYMRKFGLKNITKYQRDIMIFEKTNL